MNAWQPRLVRGSRTAPRAGLRRDARRSRRAAGSARRRSFRRSAAHATSIRPTSSAFCSPVEQSSAGMSFGRWRTSRSERCGPSSVRPAARSRSRPAASAARSSSSTSTAGRAADGLFGSPGERDARLRERAVVRQPGRSSPSAAATSSLRAAAIAVPVSAICASIASNQASSREILGKQPVASAHRLLIVERALAMAGIDGQHQPVEEAAAVGGRPGKQRVHGRRDPGRRAATRAAPRPSAHRRR